MNQTLLTVLTKTNLGRTVSHAALAFLGVVVPLMVFTSVSGLESSFLAAVPAGLMVVFRELAPNIPTQDTTNPAPPPPPPHG